MPKLKTTLRPPTGGPSPSPIPRVSFSVDEAAQSCGLSKSFLYNCMAEGKLKFIKAGSRRLIVVSELEAFLGRLSPGPEAA